MSTCRNILAASFLLQSVACRPDPARDARLYRQVLADPSVDGPRCAKVQDLALRGDCIAFLAGQRDVDGDLSADDLCGGAPKGMWRDECWFVSAEAARRGRHRKEAAAMCLRAGQFINDCGQHMWQSEVRVLVMPRRRGVIGPTFEELLPRAQAVYARWAPLLEEGTDMAVRFWRRFYQNGFERAGWIDLGRCEGLPDDHRARCIDAGVKLMWARIDLELRPAGVDPCALHQGVGPIAKRLRVVPEPALDEGLIAWQHKRCAVPISAVRP
ncbi:MAG: hypothetical protein GXP62_10470 [Oligoflexia bacterium]|nr:hypothetical protein [Oligoflexia bacterium]